MGNLVLNGSTSGGITISPPAVAGSNTISLPANTGTIITTASTGVVTQSMLASNIAGNGPAFAYQRTATQSIPASTWTKVQFNTSIFDTNSNYSNTNYRFTPTVAGYYQFNWLVVMDAIPSNAEMISAIYKNGATYVWGNDSYTSSSHYNSSTGSVLLYCNGSTDYAEIFVFQASSGAVNCTPTSTSVSMFSGFMARGA